MTLGKWETGYIEAGGYYLKYAVKYYGSPSKTGINGGKIQKLFLIKVWDNAEVAAYDRGWEHVPDNAEIDEALEKLIKQFN